MGVRDMDQHTFRFKRSSGILLPITALPDEYGIGTLGVSGRRFIDFLHEAGQRYWQILPLGLTGYGDSPYQSYSAFAGNPLLIDLNDLVDDGLLMIHEIEALHQERLKPYVDYTLQFNERYRILKRAHKRFTTLDQIEIKDEFNLFCETNDYWLKSFATFMSIKEKVGFKPWYEWPCLYAIQEPDAMTLFLKDNEEAIKFWQFTQYLFFKQYRILRAYAHKKGIRMIGDLPIYVAEDSVELWNNPEAFEVFKNGRPKRVAGCPPDAFSETGQLWGNPLYHWSKMKETSYTWWIERMKHTAAMFDVIRLDHFRGFEAYWAIPSDDETAENGVWVDGPGLEFFEAIKQALPKCEWIAEDLGDLTPKVDLLRESIHLPGMRVLQFAFGTGHKNNYLPHHYEAHTVVYTGTHDNQTLKGWYDALDDYTKAHVHAYLGISHPEQVCESLIRVAWASVADLSIAPLQDFLEIGDEGRINTPSTLGGNWSWRLERSYLTKELAKRIYDLTALYSRL